MAQATFAVEVRQPFPASAELRRLFCGQARLLADRLDRGYGLDLRSLRNLFRVAVAIVLKEVRA
jgi:hypothetical protein